MLYEGRRDLAISEEFIDDNCEEIQYVSIKYLFD